MKDYIQISKKTGEYIRQIRKEKGFRLQDIADEKVSTATISNIERGGIRVDKAKLEHICSKLGINSDQLKSSFSDNHNQKSSIDLQLMTIENTMDLVDADDALNELKDISIKKANPLIVTYTYLKAKAYFRKKFWKKSSNYYLQAINLVDAHPKMEDSNIKAASYYDLARISQFQNNLEEALKFVQDGLDSFVPDGKRKYFRYHLLTSKVIYLRKLNRIEEVHLTLDEVNLPNNEIRSTEVLLNLIEEKGTLLNNTEFSNQAIELLNDGIELARIDKMYDRSFDLWSVLGETYSNNGQPYAAELCFRHALKLKDKISKTYLLVSTLTRLGLLYLKHDNLLLAQSTLEEAVKLGMETNDVYRLCDALNALGQCFTSQGLNLEAKKCYKQALELVEKHDLKVYESDITLNLARLCEHDDPKEHHDYVMRHYRLSLEGGDRSMTLNEQSNTMKMYLESDPPDG